MSASGGKVDCAEKDRPNPALSIDRRLMEPLILETEAL